MKICFLTKLEKPGSKEALCFLKKYSKNIDVFAGSVEDPLPDSLLKIDYDLLISYISPWIVPKNVLNKTKKWNINFHPGPPEYPGIGCFNFAIYDSANQFGVTAHIMKPKVDSGKIIGVKRFLMNKDETVESLSIKTYNAQLNLFKKTLDYVFVNKCLPNYNDTWKKKPYKRSELEQLATIDLNMDQAEIDKRIRAAYYQGKPAPFIELGGYRFEYNPDR
tara:strand:+ start:332 stop:991 length:660 start_codon:yes stop_codon:yes gene_type:complete